MARTTYFAPGVYVEEIPSAQQPIAGVGTSTAAFIGLVETDTINYPVRNEHYNPLAAKIAAKIKRFQSKLDPSAEDATDDEKHYLKVVIDKWNDDLKNNSDLNLWVIKTDTKDTPQVNAPTQSQELNKLNSDLNKLDNQLKNPKLADEEKKKLEEEKKKLENDIDDLKEKINAVKSPVSPPSSGQLGSSGKDESCLSPFVYRKFKIKVPNLVSKLCTTSTEFSDLFGPYASYAKDDQFFGHRALSHAVNGFFRNGGTRCFVVTIGSHDQLADAMQMIDSIDEVSIVAAPGLDANPTTWGELVDHCDNAEDRFAILDCVRDINQSNPDALPDFQVLQYDNKDNKLPSRSKNAAFYFPWIEVIDPAKQLQDLDPCSGIEPKYQGRIYMPPSGHVAGIYARTDVERGVHKAPANTPIAGAVNVRYYISKRHQEGLNPQGVNCIRNINGNIEVWGARTIGGDLNSEWKYINVRRTFLFLRESIDEGTQWVVFEPNDIALWGKIRRNVSAFLTNVWRSGALFGATPEEAFYVKCDAELNPPEVRDLGQVITEIGVAIVRPAEFVIFRISQSAGLTTK
jgi:uncharacterized protein